MEEKPSRIKQMLKNYRERQTDEKNSSLWKTRLLFLAPFIIAAAAFLLLSLK